MRTRIPDSEALEMMQQAFGAYRAVIADLNEAERATAWEEVYGCLREFETGDGISVELSPLIGSGTKRP